MIEKEKENVEREEKEKGSKFRTIYTKNTLTIKYYEGPIETQHVKCGVM